MRWVVEGWDLQFGAMVQGGAQGNDGVEGWWRVSSRAESRRGEEQGKVEGVSECRDEDDAVPAQSSSAKS